MSGKGRRSGGVDCYLANPGLQQAGPGPAVRGPRGGDVSISLDDQWIDAYPGPEHVIYPALAVRFLSCSSSCFLRRRMDFGVTSTSSSSSMNSRACSSDIRIGGVSRMFSSLPAARMLVSCFPFRGLTTRSLSREWMRSEE